MAVNASDFGGIFAELLPGNFAKLQPPEGQDLTQGLEVKVQLGSVWKQSLTELSGGQRCVPPDSTMQAQELTWKTTGRSLRYP
jgi:chromosome segregation ATPase